MTNSFAPPLKLENTEHGVAYRNEKTFSGWPFISGFWTTANGDYIVSFQRKDADYSDAKSIHHSEVVRSGPKAFTIRSTDKGRTWDEDSLQLMFDLGSDYEKLLAESPDDYSAEGPIDFTDPDVLVATGAIPTFFQPDSKAWVRVSTDGGKNWRHPILVEQHGLPSVSGNASPLVRPDGVSLLFQVVVTDNGWKRRPAVFRAKEDGSNWAFMSYITSPYDDGAADHDQSNTILFSGHRYFYPRAINLPGGRILCALRAQRDPTSVVWTEMYMSEDGGRTWAFRSRVNDWGAPGDIVRMSDGRIACVYGYRMPPFGIRARISDDEGLTWGRELILRDDGGSWDLGYPRVVEPEPGTLLAIYYMNTKDDPIQLNGGVRHIAWTRFKPE